MTREDAPRASLLADRKMGPTERLLHEMHTWGTFVIAHVAGISGPLTEAVLRSALAAVQRRHPLLRVHVAASGQDFASEGTGLVPLRVVPRESEEHWKRVFDDELNLPIPHGTHPLIRVVLVTDGKSPRHELVLISNHAIVDGTGGCALLRDIMTACVAAHEGRVGSEESLETLAPLEALLPAWMYEKRVKPRFRLAGILPIDRNVAPSKRKSRAVFRTVDAETTTRLSAKAREEACSVHAALCAAGLKACRAVGMSDRELGLSTNVGLREWLTKPVPGDHLGTYVSSVHTHHRVTSNSEFWALAREIKGGISSAIERVEYLADVDTIALGRVARFVARYVLPRIRAGRLHALNLTNVGRIPYPTEYGPFRVESFFGGSSQHLVGSSMQIAVQTFGGVMYIAFVSADPIMHPSRLAQFVEAFEAALRGVIDGHTSASAPSRR